jgi:putative glutathione S-transferase
MVTELAPQSPDGAYVRPAAAFTTVLGSPGAPWATGRYTLYLGNACPWCHRVELTLLARGLARDVTVVRLEDNPERASRGGWVLAGGRGDLAGIYQSLAPGVRARATAPLLVDTRSRAIVSNDSAGIVASLDAVAGGRDVALRPTALVRAVDAANARYQDALCNGVYRCGFATSQVAYDAAAAGVEAALDEADATLASSRFLVGPRLTDADLRLFPTVARLDAVYGPLFRAVDRQLAAWPALAAWAADINTLDGGVLAPALDVAAAKSSYFKSLFPLNPSGIVPRGDGGVGTLAGPAGRGAQDAATVFVSRVGAY